MPDEVNTFSSALVLDLRIWWRHMHTLYKQEQLWLRKLRWITNDKLDILAKFFKMKFLWHTCSSFKGDTKVHVPSSTAVRCCWFIACCPLDSLTLDELQEYGAWKDWWSHKQSGLSLEGIHVKPEKATTGHCHWTNNWEGEWWAGRKVCEQWKTGRMNWNLK